MLSETPHNLPSRLTSFVGREREVGEMAALLATQRLVTLDGAPGVGKTRLSLQIAAHVLDGFPDGVWLVELAPLADPELVPHAIAAVLGVHEQPGLPPATVLRDWLRSRHLLLLLDNCEHLIGAVATVADTLLQSCPGLHVLVTSREPLAIDGESIRRVPSLAVSGLVRGGTNVPAAVADPRDVAASVAESEAVRLFVERARTRPSGRRSSCGPCPAAAAPIRFGPSASCLGCRRQVEGGIGMSW